MSTKIIFILVLISAFISSCKKDDIQQSKGKVTFYFVSKTNNLKSALYEQHVSFLKVSIETSSGISQYKSDTIALDNFGNGYISVPIVLKTGDYKLTEYEVLDSAYNVVYATPIAGSPNAYLVNQPLSINFTVQKDQVTNIAPEVLSVENSVPADFGYPDFSFNITKTFLIAVFVYDTILKNFVITTSTLTILNGVNIIYTRSLDAATNQAPIQNGISNFTIKVDKPNYITYVHSYIQSELISAFNSPITIVLLPEEMDGLIAYYPFDGNANDEIGYGNNGIVNGATLIADRSGNPNSAYYFNGIGNYISLPATYFLILNEYSYSVWIKVASFPPTSIDGWIIFAVGASDNGWEQAISIHSNGDILGGGYNIGNNPNASYTETSSIQQGKWYHIVFTRNMTEVKIYINGILMPNVSTNNSHTNNQPANYGSTSYSAIIGCRSNLNPNNFFVGSIDDIRIYNRVLNESEINNLYNLK